jgi:hypothetical protein
MKKMKTLAEIITENKAKEIFVFEKVEGGRIASLGHLDDMDLDEDDLKMKFHQTEQRFVESLGSVNHITNNLTFENEYFIMTKNLYSGIKE